MSSADASRTACARPQVEPLEDRSLPAPLVSFDPGAGILAVNAPKAGVQATFNAWGQDLVLLLGGKGGHGVEVFDASMVNLIVFRGGGGNDAFVNNTSITSVAFAGHGNAVLQAGNGHDTLVGGSGKDTLVVVPGMTNFQVGGKQNKVIYRSPDPTATTTPGATPSALAAAVLAFAESHLGTQVGDGQCGTLAALALQAAGGEPESALGPSGPTDSYVWGSLVLEEAGGAGGGTAVAGSYGAVQPGDIVQFSNADFVLNTPTYNSFQSFPHHTAIIESYLGNGQFSVLQQNVNGSMAVQRGTIDFTQLTTGTVWVYQPIPA
jgi:Ca2+-binding RTX toxin-like protein